MRGPVAYARITRAHNSLAAGLATALGGYLNGATAEQLPSLLLGCAIVVLVVALGNVVNDLKDLAVDRINRPQRPLPSGAISVVEARVSGAVLAVTSLLLMLRLPPLLFAFAVVCLASGVAYSHYLKSSVLVGNVAVAVLSAATLPFGAMIIGALQPQAIAATAVVFLFILGREILKDVADHDGDQVMGVITVATHFGRDTSLRLTAVVMWLFVIAAHAPWALGMAGGAYMAAMWVLALLPTIGSVLLVQSVPSSRNIELSLRVTKLAWFNGLGVLTLLR